jgi:amidase
MPPVNPMPTVEEQVRALADGGVTSVELTTRSLDAIESLQPTLNSFTIVRRDAALAEAADADRRLAAGERAPLLGVPTAIKDETDLVGHPTAFGCGGDWPTATQDAALVTKLRGAGAIIVGKTNTPELGQWPFTENATFGATRNPWNPDYSPGGSSGGTSAAVASGVVAAGFGADGAGSIRIPCAWTNLVGIKPQRGRVSTMPAPELFHGLTVYGPMSRTVAEAAYLLDVASGPMPGDRYTPPAPDEPFRTAADREPGRLRIALSTRVPFSGFPAELDPRVRAAVTRLAGVLAGLGHEVVEDDPRYGLVGTSFLPRSLAGLHDWVGRVPDPAALDPRTRANARNGALLRGPALAGARAFEKVLHRQVGAVFKRVDVVLAPTTAQPPLLVGATDGASGTRTDRAIIAACPYAWPWNVLGWPSINVPAGFTPVGLPVGAQLMGPANSESLLISLAAQLESAERWYERVPRHAVAVAAR